MPRLSVNIIVKNGYESLVKTIESLETNFLNDDDEIVIVDTGSTAEQFVQIADLPQTFEKVKVYDRKDLSHDYRPFVDKWLPEHVEVLQKSDIYQDFTGLLDFSAARNAALELSTNDLILWIDSDDTFVDQTNGQFRAWIDENMPTAETAKFEAVFLDYNYGHGEDGALTTLLRRERFFWKSKYHWVARCHETAIIRPGLRAGPISYLEDLPVRIEHFRPPERGSTVSDVRNYIILRNELEEGGEVDPRTLFYLANASRGVGHLSEALALYQSFDAQSGSVEDRWCAAYYSGNIFMDKKLNRPLNALDLYTKCVELKPNDPRGYFGMARAYGALCRWNESLHWFDVGMKFGPPQTLHSYDPTHIHWMPHLQAAHVCKELNLKDRAMEHIRQAVNARPGHPDSHQNAQLLQAWAVAREFEEAMSTVIGLVPGGAPVQRKVMQKVTKHYPHVPYWCEKNGMARPEAPDPRPRSNVGRIDFYCGSTLEGWGPDNVKTGIGGSEKMVLILAPMLQKLGWNVTVYAETPPSQRGVRRDGVRYEHWATWDSDRPRDVIVFWRAKGYVKMLKNPARKKILWLHDVQDPGHYDEQLLQTVDAIQVQSEYHLAPIKEIVPADKIWVARNAIQSGRYDVTQGDPKRVLYCSSPDRGVASALQVVRAAQQIDPEINITIGYGFTPFYRQSVARCPGIHRHCPDLGRDCGMDDYERLVWQLVDETKARVIHRVGFKEIADEMQQAGAWLYPTRFPEISCMVAMEAQAAGLVPLCTRFGALAETILPEGNALAKPLPPLEKAEWTKEWVVAAAKQLLQATQIPVSDPRRKALSDAAKKAFSVRSLAKIWHERLGGGKIKGGSAHPTKSVVACGAESSHA